MSLMEKVDGVTSTKVELEQEVTILKKELMTTITVPTNISNPKSVTKIKSLLHWTQLAKACTTMKTLDERIHSVKFKILEVTHLHLDAYNTTRLAKHIEKTKKK